MSWKRWPLRSSCGLSVRRAGELLKDMAESGERHTGSGDQKTESRRVIPKLKDLGVSPMQSHRWQQVAAVWAMGDVVRLVHEPQYGDAYGESIEVFGRSYSHLANLKSVSQAFSEFYRRRENLTWSHHAIVAPFSEKEADELLDLCEEHQWTREDLPATKQVAHPI